MKTDKCNCRIYTDNIIMHEDHCNIVAGANAEQKDKATNKTTEEIVIDTVKKLEEGFSPYQVEFKPRCSLGERDFVELRDLVKGALEEMKQSAREQERGGLVEKVKKLDNVDYGPCDSILRGDVLRLLSNNQS